MPTEIGEGENMKKLLTLLLVAAMAIGSLGVFASCGEETKPVVGLICLHGENSTYDKNFIDAFKTACKDAGLKSKQYKIVTDIAESNDCYDAAADLADSGCKAIFADSFGHEQYMIKAAKQYTDVQFFHATGTQAKQVNLANYHNAFASIYEGRYLAGYAAGLKLNTMKDKAVDNNFKVGYVGAWTYAEVISGYTSWYLGLKAALDDGYTASMLVQFTGSWYDEAGEKEAAKNLIKKGCVLISQHADSMGAPTACDTNKVGDTEVADPIPNVAYNGSTGKNTLVAYSKINWVPYFKKVVDAALKGTAVATDYTGTINDGSVQWALGAAATDGAKAQIEAVQAELENGTRKVFDLNTFTVTVSESENTQATVDANGKLTACLADIDGDYVPDTNVVTDGYYNESALRSAPYFDIRIDGIKLLNAVYGTKKDENGKEVPDFINFED